MTKFEKFCENVYFESSCLKGLKELLNALDNVDKIASHLKEASTINRTVVDDETALENALIDAYNKSQLLRKLNIDVQKQSTFNEIEDLLVEAFRILNRIVFRESITNNNRFMQIISDCINEIARFLRMLKNQIQNNNLVLYHKDGTPLNVDDLNVHYYQRYFCVDRNVRDKRNDDNLKK